MGQDASFNCKAGKSDEHEIETTQANALKLLKGDLYHQDSDMKSKHSLANRTDQEGYNTFNGTIPSQNQRQTPLPQHENILRVAYSPFPGSERVGSKFAERGAKSVGEIVQARYHSDMHFPKSQVVVLIESLMYGLAYLEKFDYRHHDFYPANVYYCNGLFKIVNPALIDTSAYSLTQESKRFSFLSPQLISELLAETPEGDILPDVMYKSDIFAIGMIVLEFCTLEPSAQCYDEETYSLVDQVIRERLTRTAKLYSPAIADCLAEMLRYDVQTRVGVQQLALLVFLKSQQEKKEDKAAAATRSPPPGQVPAQPQRPYQPNPAHVQQKFVVLPPGEQPQGRQVPLNPNTIGLPMPNYNYSRIGPQNQGFVSTAGLQNKLRVIELIHQNSQEEEDSQGMMSGNPSGVTQTHEIRTPKHSHLHSKLQPHPEVDRVPAAVVHSPVIQPPVMVHQPSPVHMPPPQAVVEQRQILQEKAPQSVRKMSNEQQPTKQFTPAPITIPEPAHHQINYPIQSIETAPISMPPQPYQQVTGSKTSNQSKYMYSLASDNVPASGGIMARKELPGVGDKPPTNSYVTAKYSPHRKDENGETLEARVDRILRMSRQIK